MRKKSTKSHNTCIHFVVMVTAADTGECCRFTLCPSKPKEKVNFACETLHYGVMAPYIHITFGEGQVSNLDR